MLSKNLFHKYGIENATMWFMMFAEVLKFVINFPTDRKLPKEMKIPAVENIIQNTRSYCLIHLLSEIQEAIVRHKLMVDGSSIALLDSLLQEYYLPTFNRMHGL